MHTCESSQKWNLFFVHLCFGFQNLISSSLGYLCWDMWASLSCQRLWQAVRKTAMASLYTVCVKPFKFHKICFLASQVSVWWRIVACQKCSPSINDQLMGSVRIWRALMFLNSVQICKSRPLHCGKWEFVFCLCVWDPNKCSIWVVIV